MIEEDDWVPMSKWETARFIATAALVALMAFSGIAYGIAMLMGVA